LRVLTITYNQVATTDIVGKYVKRRGAEQGCAFFGSQNHNLTSTQLFSPKTAILGPDFDGTWKLWAEKTALTLEVLRVNRP